MDLVRVAQMGALMALVIETRLMEVTRGVRGECGCESQRWRCSDCWAEALESDLQCSELVLDSRMVASTLPVIKRGTAS